MSRVHTSTIDAIVPSQTVTEACSPIRVRGADGIGAQAYEG